MRLRNCGDRSQIGKCHDRIARCLDQNEFGIRSHRAPKSGRITLIYLCYVDSKPRQQLLQEVRGATVMIRLRDHVIPLADDRQDCGAYGSHARTGHQRGLGSLQRGEHAFYLAQSWIPITGIKLRMTRLARTSGKIFARVSAKRSGLIDRRHDRGCGVQFAVGMD